MPTVTGINPDTVAPPEYGWRTATVTGTGFLPDADVSASGTGVDFFDVEYHSATTLTCSILVDANATVGSQHNVVVTDSGGTGTLTNGFTVGGTVHTVPGSIDATGATDASAALQAWINGRPDGASEDMPTILRFAAGATYRVDYTIDVTDDRQHIRFDCPSGTKPVFSGASGHAGFVTRNAGESCSAYFTRAGINTSPEIVAVRTRAGFDVGDGCNDIMFTRLVYEGGNPSWSNDTGDCMEACAAWSIRGATHVHISECEAYETWGDAFSLQGGSTSGVGHYPTEGVWIHGCTYQDCGRIGLLINNCRYVLFEENTCGRNHSSWVHAEPNFADSISEQVWVQDNTVTPYDPPGSAQGTAHVDAQGGNSGAITRHLYVLRNSFVNSYPTLTMGLAGFKTRSHLYWVENTAAAQSEVPQCLAVKDTDFILIEGNHQQVDNARNYFDENRCCAVTTNRLDNDVFRPSGTTTNLFHVTNVCDQTPAPSPAPTSVPAPPSVWPFEITSFETTGTPIGLLLALTVAEPVAAGDATAAPAPIVVSASAPTALATGDGVTTECDATWEDSTVTWADPDATWACGGFVGPVDGTATPASIAVTATVTNPSFVLPSDGTATPATILVTVTVPEIGFDHPQECSAGVQWNPRGCHSPPGRNRTVRGACRPGINRTFARQ